MIVVTGHLVVLEIAYGCFHTACVESIKPLPYGMVSYLVNGQWYSDPWLSKPRFDFEIPEMVHRHRSIKAQTYPLALVRGS